MRKKRPGKEKARARVVHDGACLSLLDSNALKRKVDHVLLINKLVEEERLAIKDGEDPKLHAYIINELIMDGKETK